MSQWSRKYNRSDTGNVEVSQETRRYIKHLQFRSNNCSFLEENEEDDITEELMTRIEMNGKMTRQPKEVREAREVIQNWLQIENEAQHLRHHKSNINKTNICTNPEITSTLRRKYISKKYETKKYETKKLEKVSSVSSISSSFDEKFEKMKIRAMNRAKHHKFESNKKQIISNHKESKIKTKQMVENVFEFKEEEFINNGNVYNAEQKLRYDLIPSSKFNKIYKDKQKYLNKLETRKVLLFQLNEIEKQERFHNKKLITKIMSGWKKQINESQEIEKNAINLYRNNVLKKSFNGWIDYIYNSKQTMIDIFREWIKIRLISQQNQIKAIEFYEYGLQDNIFFIWRDHTKHCIEARKIRAIQLQTRLYKMNKIATRHYKFGIYCKIIKSWKQYVNHQQTARFLEQQRKQRQLKIQKLISSVKQKTKTQNLQKKILKPIQCNDKKTVHKISNKTETKNIQTETSENVDIKIDDNISKDMISHSIQTEMKESTEISNNMNNNRDKRKRGVKRIDSLKPSKLLIEMEKRAIQRKQKREKLMELKQQKEKEYQEFLLKKKQIEIEKIKEMKRIEKQEKIEKLQKKMYLKEIESNKLILSQLHYNKALIMYYGWIPWMKSIEQNNLNYYKIVVIRNHNIQKRFWNSWQSVINRRKKIQINAKKAAYIGREIISNKLFVIKVEEKYWSFWKDIILKYKMMNAMISEKNKLNMIQIYLKKWKKQYQLQLNKKEIKEQINEEMANKHSNLVLTKRMMILWKQKAITARKEKIKARTWRKVEVWLTELRANR